MKHIVWVVALGVLAGLGYWVWLASRRYEARKRAAEERFASFMAQTLKAPATGAAAAASAATPATPAIAPAVPAAVGSSRVDLQACKLEYSIVSPK